MAGDLQARPSSNLVPRPAVTPELQHQCCSSVLQLTQVDPDRGGRPASPDAKVAGTPTGGIAARTIDEVAAEQPKGMVRGAA